MYTVYAYWNADQITSVLNAVAMIMNGGDFLGLMKAVAVAGLLIAVGGAIVRMKGEEPVVYLTMMIIFYMTLFVPRVTVTVKDVRANTNYQVANVPLGVAFFASETSHIGKWMTEAFETAFTPADEERFSKTGMAFGSRLLEELQSMRADLPSLERDMAMFVRKCVNPELLDNPALLDDLTKSTDLWAFIGGSGALSLNPARSTLVRNTPMPCTGSGGAYNTLNGLLAAQTTNQLSALGARVNPGNTLATTVILNQLPAVEASLLGVSRSAQDAVRQSIVANVLRDCKSSPMAMQGSDPGCLQTSAAVAMAEESAKVSYASMAKVAAATLPKLRNAIELITIGIFPVVFLLIVIAGTKAGLVLKSYVSAMFWVQLWAPLYAIINAMAVKSDKADLLGIVHLSGGTTLANMSRLANEALSNQSIAGLLTISVPVIALALIKGGEVAMSGVASSIMGTAQSSAQRAGDAIGQGNIAAGNVSWGNVNSNSWGNGNWSDGNRSWDTGRANKWDTTPETSGSGFSRASNEWGSITQGPGGRVTGASANGFSVGATVSGSTAMSASSVQSSSTALSGTQTSGQTNSLTTSSGWRSTISNGTRYESGTYSGSYIGASTSFGLGWATSQQRGTESGSTSQSGTNREQAESLRMGLGVPSFFSAGGGGGGGASSRSPLTLGITGNASLTNSVSANTLDSARRSLSSSSGTDIKESADSGSRSGSETRNSSSRSTDFSKTRGAEKSSQSSESAQFAATRSAGTSDSRGTSNQVGASVSSGLPVFQALGGGKGSTPEEQRQSAFDALRGSQDPGTLTAATQQAATAFGGTQPAKDMLGEGVTPPASTGSVRAQAAQSVSGLAATGAKDVGTNPSTAGSAGGPPGGSGGGSRRSGKAAPNLASASQAAFEQTASKAVGQSKAEDAAARDGAATLAAGVGAFRDRNGSALSAAKHAVSPTGLQFDSGAGYAATLRDRAANDPGLRATLDQVKTNGGLMTQAQRDYIMLKLR